MFWWASVNFEQIYKAHTYGSIATASFLILPETIHKILEGSVRANRFEPGRCVLSLPAMHNPFRYFNSSPEVIRLTVMMYVRFPLSLRQVEDLLYERGIDICHGA